MPRGVYLRTEKYKRKLSEETKNKISEFHKGNKYSLGKKHIEETKRKMSDAHRKNFVGIQSLHSRINKIKGKPKKCEFCGTETAKKYEWANIEHKNYNYVNSYIRLCLSCHRKYDGAINGRNKRKE
jgi:hypothetical protein